jgi:hypothetical protein
VSGRVVREEVEIWVCVDTNGEKTIGSSKSEVLSNHSRLIGDEAPRRLIKIVLSVPLQEFVTLSAVVPEQAREGMIMEVQS